MHEYVPAEGAVTVFSAPWCGFCTQLKRQFERFGIPYRDVDIDQDSTAEKLAAEANGGAWLIPTVVLPDGSTLVNPGIEKVRAALAPQS